MDLSRLRKGERIFAASAILLLLTSFLPFWGKVVFGELQDSPLAVDPQRFSAWTWNSTLLKVGLVLTILGILLVAARAIPTVRLGLPVGPLYLGAGALVTVLVAISASKGPTSDGAFELGVVEVSRGPFLYLAVILGLAMAAGGYLVTAEDRSKDTPVPGSPDAPYGTSF
jgi:uncharacterized membrane protein